MDKKTILFSVLIVSCVCFSGCALLLAGVVGGAGTATWLSGKLVQEVDASLEDTVRAAEKGLESLDMAVTKKVVKSEVAQIQGEYTDGRAIWIDIHRVLADTSKIEVRVGVTSDQDAARKVLNQIMKYL